MLDPESDSIGRVVEKRCLIVVIEDMLEVDGRTGITEPIFSIRTQSPAMRLIVHEVPGAVRRVDDRAAQGITRRHIAKIRTRHDNVVDRQRMARHIRNGQLVQVADLPGIPVHRQVTRLADLGLPDHHVVILPVDNVTVAGKGHRRLVGQGAQDLHVQPQEIPVVRTELPVEAGWHDDFIVTLLLGGRNVDIVRLVDVFIPVPGDDQLEVGLRLRAGDGAVLPSLGVHVHGVGLVIRLGLPALCHFFRPDQRRIVALAVLGDKAIPALRIIVIREIRCRQAVAAAQADRIHAVFHINHHAVEHRTPHLRHRHGLCPGIVRTCLDSQMHRVFHMNRNRHLAGIAFDQDGILADQVRARIDQFQHLDTPHHEAVLPVVRRTDEVRVHGNGVQVGKCRGFCVSYGRTGIVGDSQHRHLLLSAIVCSKQMLDGAAGKAHLERRLILVTGCHAVVQAGHGRIFPRSHIALGHLAGKEVEIHPGNQVLMIAADAALRPFRLRLDGVVAHQRQFDAGRQRRRRRLYLRNTRGRQTKCQAEQDMTNASHAIMG